MNIRLNRDEGVQQIIREVLQDLDEANRLVWWHKGPSYSHFDSDVPFIIEFVNEGDVPFIQTIRLDTLEKYPLATHHLVTDGIFLDRSRNPPVYKVVHTKLGKNRVENTNFCAVPKEDVEAYLKARRALILNSLYKAMEQVQSELKSFRSFEKRAVEFGEENGLDFKPIL